MIEGTTSEAEELILLKLLSESSRARIELVYQKRSGRMVVRKTLREADPSIYLCLMEAQIPGIPKIYAVAPQGNHVVVVEEWLEGCTLLDFLNQNGPLNERTAIEWMSQLCRILCAVHARRIVHRDIKPSNLMVTPNGQLYLIDFDSARVYHPLKEQDTVCLGTRGYAAPEQFGFAQTDARTDVYSMGVVFQQALGPSYSMGISRFGLVIQHCIPLDPNQRYQTAHQVLTDLQPVLSPYAAAQAQPAPRKSRQGLGGRVSSIGVTVLVWVLLAIGLFSNPDIPLFSDKLVLFAGDSLVLLPLLAFFTNLFQIRSRPILPAFRVRGMKKWYVALYFFFWFILCVVVVTLSPSLLSPQAQNLP